MKRKIPVSKLIRRTHPFLALFLAPWVLMYALSTNTGMLRVERQKFGMAYFLEMLHRRRGYQHAFWANDLWAFLVDGFILSILGWAATGL